MDLNKAFDQAEQLEGYFYRQQALEVAPYVQKIKKGGLLVELGTFRGRSALFWSLVNPDISVVTIDASLGDPGYIVPGTKIDPRALQPNVTFIESTFDEASKKINRKIDFLFIDGNHSYESVARDISVWAGKVKRGGYILFHDYIPAWPGVMKAVDEIKDNYKVILESDIVLLQK
jgi:predicted O-methyltransferase YrrM